MKEPTLDLADNLGSRGITTDIEERRKYWRLRAFSYCHKGQTLCLVVSKKAYLLPGAPNIVAGCKLHAGQVKKLRNFLNKWLDYHYTMMVRNPEGEGK